jgi:hypothetical protein
MIRNCAVITALFSLVIFAIEKPILIAACSANNCGSYSSSCSCVVGPQDDYCYPNSEFTKLTILEYFSTTTDCSVRLSGEWYCLYNESKEAALISTADGGEVIPACTTLPNNKCIGTSWTTCCGGWTVSKDCSVGTSTFNVILEIRETCDTCSSYADLLWHTVQCSCSSCP